MKRFFDLLFCLVFIIPISFFILLLSLFIIFVDKMPPLFFQERIGKDGKKFVCYKLQTMRPPSSINEIGDHVSDKQRVTKLGVFLRDHGWDELPQIWNVLLGNMSLLGPRPLIEKDIKRLEVENIFLMEIWKKRFALKPGISGWCQVNTKKSNPYEIKYDIEGNHKKLFSIFFRTSKFFMFGGHEV